MPSTLVSLRRIVAFFVAVTRVAAPIASAQSPGAGTPFAATANTALLSNAAFARLIRPPSLAAPSRIVKDTPRLDLLHYGTTAMVRQAPAQVAATKAPQQKSWVSRHPKTMAGIIIGAVLGGVMLAYLFTGDHLE
jgi:hypothetical protein